MERFGPAKRMATRVVAGGMLSMVAVLGAAGAASAQTTGETVYAGGKDLQEARTNLINQCDKRWANDRVITDQKRRADGSVWWVYMRGVCA